MLHLNRSQGIKNNFLILITIPSLISFLCVACEIYCVNFSQTRWHDILKTIDRNYNHICITQANVVIAGNVFLFLFFLFFIYLTRYFENSQYNILNIFSFKKKKTYAFLGVCLVAFFAYFCFAFREIRKTTPGNCAKIKQRHDSVFQTWNWNFRENWEKIYDTSFIFYNLVCFHIYRKKINLLIASSIGIFLLSVVLFIYPHTKDNYPLPV